jgi:hypothetical protein
VGTGATRPIPLAPEELAAFACVIHEWELEAETVRRLRKRQVEVA